MPPLQAVRIRRRALAVSLTVTLFGTSAALAACDDPPPTPTWYVLHAEGEPHGDDNKLDGEGLLFGAEDIAFTVDHRRSLVTNESETRVVARGSMTGLSCTTANAPGEDSAVVGYWVGPLAVEAASAAAGRAGAGDTAVLSDLLQGSSLIASAPARAAGGYTGDCSGLAATTSHAGTTLIIAFGGDHDATRTACLDDPACQDLVPHSRLDVEARMRHFTVFQESYE